MKQITVVVKKPFLDRYTGLKRKQGDRLTVSEKRYREMNRSGEYVSIVADTKETAKPEKATEIKK